MGSTQTHFSEDKTETQRDEEIYGVWNEHKFGIKPRLPDFQSLIFLLECMNINAGLEWYRFTPVDCRFPYPSIQC